VYELSDRERPVRPKDFFSLIPLSEILSEILGCGPATKKVTAVYEGLLHTLGPELQILMNVPFSDLETAGGGLLATAIERMRRNQVIREEGYDGEYGVISLFERAERDELAGQATLFKPVKGQGFPKKKNFRADDEFSQKVKKPIAQGGIESSATQGRPSAPDPILSPLNPAQREAVLHRGVNDVFINIIGQIPQQFIFQPQQMRQTRRHILLGQVRSDTHTNNAKKVLGACPFVAFLDPAIQQGPNHGSPANIQAAHTGRPIKRI
jgi:hypothetical protein